ncbi:MAG: bifunctional demethylmenaquinone methyltransferase/2-methoxy-6-polyprenyl-1,4-benzoquinol methylase UbiE [bacterium]
MKLDSIKPDPASSEEKATQLRRIFNAIAPVYDRGNALLSFGLAARWRQQAVASFHANPPQHVLDVACGTGDFVVAVLDASPTSEVMGVDFSEEMLCLARKKVSNAVFLQGDVMALPFDACRFDAVTVGFGLRNFVDIPKALSEMARVLKPGRCLIILEATKPGSRLKQELFKIYQRSVAPLVGWMTGHPGAYSYLMRSMQSMPSSHELEDMLTATGFTSIRKTNFVFDMCVCYYAIRS